MDLQRIAVGLVAPAVERLLDLAPAKDATGVFQQQLQQVLLGKTSAQDAMATVDKSAARLR